MDIEKSPGQRFLTKTGASKQASRTGKEEKFVRGEKGKNECLVERSNERVCLV